MVPEITEEQKKAWREREALRLRDGTYTELPDNWQNAHWFGSHYGQTISHHRLEIVYEPRYPDHFAHVSVDKVAMIAFTENDQKGVRDRQTRISPGRYLTRFFSEQLSKSYIQALATEMGATYDEQDVELKFAKTADEIEHVYCNGPSSCMDGRHKFDSEQHPTRVYAGFDLAVAYLERQERITARVLVWPEKKHYGRIYGDTIRMETALAGAGYTHSDNFHGAKIAKLMQDGAYVIPYLDGAVCGAIDHGNHLTLSDGTNTSRSLRLCCSGDRQNGLSEDGGIICEGCGDGVDEDDAQSSDYGYQYCGGCFRRRYGYCERYEQDVPRGELEPVRVQRLISGGRAWVTQEWGEHARDSHAFFCEVDEVYYCESNNTRYEIGLDTWGPAAFERNGVTIDGVHYDKSNLPDGVVLPEALQPEVQANQEVLPLEAPEIVVGCFVVAVDGTDNITVGNVYKVTRVFMEGPNARIGIETNDAGRPDAWRKDAFHFYSPAVPAQRPLHIRHEPNGGFAIISDGGEATHWYADRRNAEITLRSLQIVAQRNLNPLTEEVA